MTNETTPAVLGLSEGLGPNETLVGRLRQERRPTAWTRGLDVDYPTAWEPNLLCHEAAAEIVRLRCLVEAVRGAFNRECDDADAILRLLGLDPEKCRTDGGSLVMPELLGAIEHRDVMTRRDAKPKWLPIETAPRDGKENVLLFDGKTVSAGGWTTDLDAGAEYEGQLGMFGWWWIEGGDCAPTHWMPLPTAKRWQFGVPQSDEPQNAVQAAYGGLTQTAQG